ncbi:MAG: hypothetical protein A2Z24_02895 [Candidatus Woykebacteria bacterium RBG_16_44_10]|uniref:Uncharacterized protein n=1 Tax=Candidatus Woykebacteria bacterium RBG_16_44_10 TaxID=1802597 RepID=A0A1G1WCR3_9BACT|nr:MAG: hypothetical protein A2Z24_02895 [Candidatus Woykebacteria bacterium RBG_16_44_10]
MTKKVEVVKQKFSRRGFGLLEIVIVGAIIALGFMAIISFLIFSRGVTFEMGRRTEATSLAEEGMEVVRQLRDDGWTANIASKTAGTNYYPVISGSSWTLSGTNPGVINNLYTRTVQFATVYRNSTTDDVEPTGVEDQETKEVTVRVSWQESGRNKEVVLTTYITNFLDN